MKTAMQLLLGCLAALALGAVSARTGQPIEEEKPWLEPVEEEEPEDIVCEELSWELPIQFPQEDVPESDVSWHQMVQDTVMLWELFFDNDNAPIDDPRRDNFELYAEYLADAIITYQNQETDIGGRLPRHPSTHYLLATMVTKESSVTHDVVGKMHKKFEVGLLQTHGTALAGIRKDVVRKKPKLGLLLGVRWLAAQIARCHPEGIDDRNWTEEDWLEPLSVYAGGPKAIRADGTCKVFKVAKERLKQMRLYQDWVEGEMAVRREQ